MSLKNANIIIKKNCFVVSPIGDGGSDTRRRSDQILRHVITPVVIECGYNHPERADQISEPGLITSQVIQKLLNDDLVIADLSGHNPNVFYELAIRHAVRKPCVQIIAKGEKIPFDVSTSRTIPFDYKDLDSVAECKDELRKQIVSVEVDSTLVDSPVSVAVDVQSLRASDNPIEKSNAQIISMLNDLRFQIVDNANAAIRPSYSPVFEDLIQWFHALTDFLYVVDNDGNVKVSFIEMDRIMGHGQRLFEMVASQGGISEEMCDLIEFLRKNKKRKRIK